jgi:hypothetical protein
MFQGLFSLLLVKFFHQIPPFNCKLLAEGFHVSEGIKRYRYLAQSFFDFESVQAIAD